MDRGIAIGLRQVAIDVVTSAEAGLLGAPDTVQLAYAHAAGRVIVTQDRDFTRLHARQVEHSGIAYSEQGSRSIRQIIEMLKLLDEVYDPHDMVRRLEYI